MDTNFKWGAPIQEPVKISYDPPKDDFYKARISALEKENLKLRAEISEWMEQPEDVLSYAQFPKVALDFFEKRRNARAGINGKLLDKKNMIHPI